MALVANPLVGYSDLEWFLCAWYRWWLATRPEEFCEGVEVVNAEPGPEEGSFPARLLVIRDNGGPDTSLVTAERAVDFSVLAGTRANPEDANDLARMVHAGRLLIPSPGFATTLPDEPRNPVTNVISATSPIPVAESQDRARRLIGMTLGVSPEPL